MAIHHATSSASTRRPSRPRRIGRFLSRLVIVGVLLLLGTVVTAFAASEWKARRTFNVPTHAFTAPSTAAAAARGKRLATVRFCQDCHGEGLVGRVMLDEAAVGRIAAPNLTTGGAGARLSDTDWERAVRHGVRRDGTGLLIMPSHEFASLTDEDLGDIIAYARSVPSSTAQHGALKLGPVLRALDLGGKVSVYAAAEIDHTAPHTASLPEEPTREYGKYLASTCTGCHGPGLSGGPIPGAPPDWMAAANITPTGIGHYSYDDLARLLRTGMRPAGTKVNDLMPWKFTRSFNDVELRALWAYLQSVPPKPFGQR